MLSPAEQRELMDIAWKSIRRTVRGEDCRTPAGAVERALMPESMLSQPAGAFVSLYNRRRIARLLRGHRVRNPARRDSFTTRRAFGDGRPAFPAVTEDELDDIQIEISVLSPLREISAIEEIQVGKHGLFIVAGMYRGLLLPQVAVKHRWNVTRFLEETCVKAGLPRDQWKHAETNIYIFSAQIIEQKPS